MNGKPVKVNSLRLIEHLGKWYATIDGNMFWVVEPHILTLLKFCNGLRTMDQLVDYIAQGTPFNTATIKSELIEILGELERNGIIIYK